MRKMTPQEAALWEEMTKDIPRHFNDRVSKPLRFLRLNTAQHPEKRTPRRALPDPDVACQRILEAAYGKSYGIVVLRQNKAKTIMPEATLDLHGLTQAQAVPKLRQFLFDSQSRHRLWVKVITGKSGIFFTLLPRYLQDNAPFVSGYLYARPNDGGRGAVYVRIRKPDRGF